MRSICRIRCGAVTRHADMAARNDSDQVLVSIERGQPPHLDIGHIAGDFVDDLLLEAVLNVCRHDIADGRIRATAHCRGAWQYCGSEIMPTRRSFSAASKQPDIECRHRLGGISVV